MKKLLETWFPIFRKSEIPFLHNEECIYLPHPEPKITIHVVIKHEGE